MRLGLFAFAVLATSSACFDTQDEFDKFLSRSEPFRSEPVAGECFGRVDLSGRYLFGAAVALDPSKPIRFDSTFTVDSSSDPWQLTVTLHSLTVTEGTPVGETFQATSPVASDGTFALDFGTIVVPGAADPLVPADVTTTLVVKGCTSTPVFACGNLEGDISKPVQQTLTGSTWALVTAPAGTEPGTLPVVAACPAK
ncbi:MAG: hypothetical protein U1F43_30420 [Myxococcota bacterium]